MKYVMNGSINDIGALPDKYIEDKPYFDRKSFVHRLMYTTWKTFQNATYSGIMRKVLATSGNTWYASPKGSSRQASYCAANVDCDKLYANRSLGARLD